LVYFLEYGTRIPHNESVSVNLSNGIFVMVRSTSDSSNLDLLAQEDLAEGSTICDSRSPLFMPRPFYKPFQYPWAYEAWVKQQRLHWLPEEVTMSDDIKDWSFKLTDEERNLLTQIFRFFTQMDVEVGGCYLDYYTHIFQPFEIKMMLAAFANMETIHVEAYAYLLDSIGMPVTEYQAFMKYKEMKDKWDYMQEFRKGNSVHDLALILAVYGAFTEGLQLFGSFAMLMNFPRHNKMKGMGQIVTWSVRDETLHTLSMIRLFHTVIQEHPSVFTQSFKQKISMICEKIVSHEDAFIDLAFELGPIEGLSSQDTKSYVRYIADRRLDQLGLKPLYGIERNPLPWMDEIMNGLEHSNFFEIRSTEYGQKSTQGDWQEAF
jgi:ribonucleoside-diphosphate reductase beta chain